MFTDFSQIYNDAEIAEREVIMAEMNSMDELDAMADMIEAKDIETAHDWQATDSQFTNENETDVRCSKCQMSGSRNNKTGDVFYPAT